MNQNTTVFIFDASAYEHQYTGLTLWWEENKPRSLDGPWKVVGYAVTPKGSFPCEFSPNGDFSHIDGVDSNGKAWSEWDFPETHESEVYRGAGNSAGLFRCDVTIREFPFFLTNVRGSWVRENSLVARLSVERLGELPQVQLQLLGNARFSQEMGSAFSPPYTGEEPITEGMMLPVEWGELPRACVGTVHLRRKLGGREWLVDYYGVHGFEMQLAGASLVNTVFDCWDSRNDVELPAFMRRSPPVPEHEKYGNVRLSAELGVIVGHA